MSREGQAAVHSADALTDRATMGHVVEENGQRAEHEESQSDGHEATLRGALLAARSCHPATVTED
jgi:hypothetical protein